jgi:hypothetical protein
MLHTGKARDKKMSGHKLKVGKANMVANAPSSEQIMITAAFRALRLAEVGGGEVSVVVSVMEDWPRFAA